MRPYYAPLALLCLVLGSEASALAQTPASPGPGPVIELPPDVAAAPAENPLPPAPAPTADSHAAPAHHDEGQGHGPDGEIPATHGVAPLQSPYFFGDPAKRAIVMPLLNLPRESQIDVSLDPRSADHKGAAVGSYGEMVVNVPLDGKGPAVADLRRTILFFGFNFTDHIRYFSEIEWEHPFTSSHVEGEIAVEQMIIDFVIRRWFNVRAGMSIIPINIVNLYHEPPTFNGVDRPDVDLFIIPSTWKQLMVGFYGAVGDLRYQLYVTPGLRAEGFTAATGIRGGVQEDWPKIRDIGVTGRVDWSPFLGGNLGLSGYFAKAGQGDPNLGNSSVTIAAFDARVNRSGFVFRGQVSYIYIGDVERLNALLFRIAPLAGPVSRQLVGGYLEGAYNLLQPLHLKSSMLLYAFFRYNRTDTQLDVPEAVVTSRRQVGFDRSSYVAGLTYKPIFEIAIKADYTYRHTEVANSGSHLLNLGLGYQF